MSAGSMCVSWRSSSDIQNGPWLMDAGCSTKLTTPPSDSANLNDRRFCTLYSNSSRRTNNMSALKTHMKMYVEMGLIKIMTWDQNNSVKSRIAPRLCAPCGWWRFDCNLKLHALAGRVGWFDSHISPSLGVRDAILDPSDNVSLDPTSVPAKWHLNPYNYLT